MVLHLRNLNYHISFALLSAAAALLVALILMNGRQAAVRGNAAAPDPAEKCAAFLVSRGWDIVPEPVEQTEVVIPAVFNEVYARYNALQLSQGMDLSPYKGKTVLKLVFTVLNHPRYPADPTVRATLLFYNGAVIGGDVSSVRLNGFMHGLARAE